MMISTRKKTQEAQDKTQGILFIAYNTKHIVGVHLTIAGDWLFFVFNLSYFQ